MPCYLLQITLKLRLYSTRISPTERHPVSLAVGLYHTNPKVSRYAQSWNIAELPDSESLLKSHRFWVCYQHLPFLADRVCTQTLEPRILSS